MFSVVTDYEPALEDSQTPEGDKEGGEEALGEYAPPGRKPSQKLPGPSLGLIFGEGRTALERVSEALPFFAQLYLREECVR